MAYETPTPGGVGEYSLRLGDRDNPALTASLVVESNSMSEPSVADLEEFFQRLVNVVASHPSLVLSSATRKTEAWSAVTPEELVEPPEPEIPPIDPPEEPEEPGDPGPPAPEGRKV
jgi:hypothetical protein